MTQLSIVGLSGNISSPSKTRKLVETALAQAQTQVDAATQLFEIADFGEDLGRARRLTDLSPGAQAKLDTIFSADALIVATPIYKASYPGLFKHLIDLIDPAALIRKPVLLAKLWCRATPHVQAKWRCCWQASFRIVSTLSCSAQAVRMTKPMCLPLFSWPRA